MNPGIRAKSSKKLHWERTWEEPLVKIAKNYHSRVASLYVSMRNLIIITTYSKEKLKTRNSFKSLLNLRLTIHRKDANKQNLAQADHDVQLLGHNFSKHTKFTLIEQLNDTNIDKELLKYRLKKREDFWIINMGSMLNGDSIINSPC